MSAIDIHRIGRQPDAWEYPDWAWANPDGTFGNRFDDPNGQYRVLYASTQRLGCFLETLARFRPNLTVYAAFEEMDGDNDVVSKGIVPLDWFTNRLIGFGSSFGRFADIGTAGWIAHLRTTLAPLCIRLGIRDLDASALQLTAPRELTQNVSAVVYNAGWNGIRYFSKYGNDVENWALFEGVDLSGDPGKPIPFDDPDLLEACPLLNLDVESRSV